LSPITERAEFTRLESVASETVRPRQTAASRSSRLTTRARADEKLQQIEDLRLDRDLGIAAAQLAPAGIEDELTEMIQQNPNSAGPAPTECGTLAHHTCRKNHGVLKSKSGRSESGRRKVRIWFSRTWVPAPVRAAPSHDGE
jgi:hypothetical protein